MGVKEALESIGKSLSGGLAGAAAKALSPAEVSRRNDPDAQAPQPKQAASDADSKMVDPKSGIRFKKGGVVPPGDKPVADLGKGQKVPPKGFPTIGNTVPSSGGYKAGGMVRRGYGKARGA